MTRLEKEALQALAVIQDRATKKHHCLRKEKVKVALLLQERVGTSQNLQGHQEADIEHEAVAVVAASAADARKAGAEAVVQVDADPVPQLANAAEVKVAVVVAHVQGALVGGEGIVGVVLVAETG